MCSFSFSFLQKFLSSDLCSMWISFFFSFVRVFWRKINRTEMSKWKKKETTHKQIKHYHVNMSVVFHFSLFVSLFLLSCSLFLKCRCLLFFFRVFFFTSLWFAIVKTVVCYFYSFMVTHFGYCAHFHCHTCRKTTQNITYITWSGYIPTYSYIHIYIQTLHQCQRING